MRKQRSIRNRTSRKKIKTIDLDITSLLDILVIMLVFLLKSYSSSTVTFNISKDIVLPRSESTSINSEGVNIQVSSDKIWVDNELIYDKSKYAFNKEPAWFYSDGGRKINPLFNELWKKKKFIEQSEKSSPQAKKFSGVANLVVDKSVKYTYIRKIMYTTALAGFQQYKFVVLGQDN